MSDIVYLNGEYIHKDEAKVSIFDRGYLFGDGIYEVVPVIDGKLIDVEPFLERIDNSLRQLNLKWPITRNEYLNMLQKLVQKNKLQEGGVYTQVTRGVAPREFYFPEDITPSCSAFCFEKEIIDNPLAKSGVQVVSVKDIRWKRRDIKSLNLLGQVLAKQQAKEQGGFEGLMLEDGFITEGTSSSIYIIKEGMLITRPLSQSILPGIRRKILLEIAESEKIPVEQRAFTLQEAMDADEVFLSSATTLILPITHIDKKKVGEGKPGVIFEKLRRLYVKEILKQINE